ncbi:MAG: PIN domain-containing protein [Methanomassiliicoccaceae archaeon]|nr:PIN domain-containing protein [Methanomassiliicoccaceae archaeon]
MLRRKKRRVTVDANILIAYIVSKKEGSLERKVLIKAANDDRLLITDVIMDECINFAYKKEGRKRGLTEAAIAAKIRELDLKIISIKPIPSDDELKAAGYAIRDDDDLKILYSVSTINADIFVTRDDDFKGDVRGIRAKIMDPVSYIREEDRRQYF